MFGMFTNLRRYLQIFIMASSNDGKRKRYDDHPKVNEEVFIHNTSPIKTSRSNKDYFNAVAQTNKNFYMDIVCFQPKLHNQFRKAEEQKSPVKLTNASLTKSLKDDSLKNLMITYDTQMSIENHTLNFKPKRPKLQTTPSIQLNELSDQKISSKVNVTATTVQVIKETFPKEVRGQELDLKVIQIADATDSAHLSLWEKLIPLTELNKTYEFKELRVWEFENQKVLSTTQQLRNALQSQALLIVKTNRNKTAICKQ
ncbi:uncharacterized protein LOC135486901 [Lineus longissimus]|uniref:uncharacterized protein LOC135486901 n=1 Tax=Lineus longissimus TaxID=88925 RepID=UPI002B4C847C